MKALELVKTILLAAILIMLFTVGLLVKNASHRLNYPGISTKSDYHIVVEPGGHVWLYDGGVYDIKTKPKAIIHKNGK